jgi:hypothetical protein
MSAEIRMPVSEEARVHASEVVCRHVADMPCYGMSAPPTQLLDLLKSGQFQTLLGAILVATVDREDARSRFCVLDDSTHAPANTGEAVHLPHAIFCQRSSC